MKIKIEVGDNRNEELTRFYHNELQKIIQNLYHGEYRSYKDFEADMKQLESQLMNLEPAHYKPVRSRKFELKLIKL